MSVLRPPAHTHPAQLSHLTLLLCPLALLLLSVVLSWQNRIGSRLKQHWSSDQACCTSYHGPHIVPTGFLYMHGFISMHLRMHVYMHARTQVFYLPVGRQLAAFSSVFGSCVDCILVVLHPSLPALQSRLMSKCTCATQFPFPWGSIHFLCSQAQFHDSPTMFTTHWGSQSTIWETQKGCIRSLPDVSMPRPRISKRLPQ